MKQIYMIVLMFLIAQFIGLYVGASLIKLSLTNPELINLNITPTQEQNDITNSLFFLLYVIFGAAILLIILKIYKGVLLFMLLEALVIFIASNIVFFVVFLTLNIPFYTEVSLICSAGLATLKFFFPFLRNPVAVIASAGVGAIFGFSLGILPAILFVIGLCIYDFLAVFFTKHMIIMARELSRKNLSFSVAATGKAFKVREEEKMEEEKKEEKTTIELGTGDIAIPLMLSVSAYKLGCVIPHPSGACLLFDSNIALVNSLAVIIGSSIGLFFVLYYVFRNRTFLPALPPISLLGLLALAIVKLIGY